MIQKITKHFGINELLLIGALLVALGLGWNTVSAMQHNYKLQQQFSQLESEVELLDLENQNIKYNIEYLKTDSYLELAAREKFNKAAQGETMVNLPNTNDSKTVENSVTTDQLAVDNEEGSGWRANLVSWWQFLRGKEG